jgi:hypothetical protein
MRGRWGGRQVKWSDLADWQYSQAVEEESIELAAAE